MANDLNKVTLIGRLTRDPEFKTVNSTSLANFSLANGRVYVVNGEKREETHFFDCEVWGKLAEIVRDYAKKGKQIAIEGRLQQSTWDTPEGKKASKIKIRVENIQLLGGNTGGGSGYNQSSSSDSQYEVPAPYDDMSHGINEDDTVF